MAAQQMQLRSSTRASCSNRDLAGPQRPCVMRAASSRRPVALQSSSVACSPALRRQQQRSSHVVCVAAAQEAPATQAPTKQQWYALVANAEFFCNDVQNESLAEQLRERVRYFREQKRDIDFHLVPNPTWLDARYPKEGKQVRRPCMALVSTDKQWILFMKLRLDRVLRIDLPDSMPQDEVLSMGDDVADFPPPAKWTAPYSAYAPGWWRTFYPNGN